MDIVEVELPVCLPLLLFGGTLCQLFLDLS